MLVTHVQEPIVWMELCAAVHDAASMVAAYHNQCDAATVLPTMGKKLFPVYLITRGWCR